MITLCYASSTPSGHWNRDTRLGEYTRDRDKPLLSCMDELGLAQQMNEAQYQRLLNFAEMIWEKRKALDEGNGLRAIMELFVEIGYEDYLRGESNTEAQGERKVANFQFLLIRKTYMWQRKRILKSSKVKTSPVKPLTRPPLKPRFANWCREIYWNKKMTTASSSIGYLARFERTGIPRCLFDWLRENILPHRKKKAITSKNRLAYVGYSGDARTEDHLLQQPPLAEKG